MWVRIANCNIIQSLPVLLNRRPQTHHQLQVPARPDTDDVKFPSSLPSPNKITTNTNPPVSSVNMLRSSSLLSVQADRTSLLTKSLPCGQFNLSTSHSISAVIRHILCCKHTRPNAFGARIVVPSCLNLPALASQSDRLS